MLLNEVSLSLRERVRVREDRLSKPPHPGPLPRSGGEGDDVSKI
jgi:hypothetical protein